jgi:superoxide reductase
MPERMDVYKCDLCGNVVEVLIGGKGQLVCCGKPMQKMMEKTADQGKEKHVPVVERTANGAIVKVGDVPHPMQDDHYIVWVEIEADGLVERKYLAPGMEPKAEFCVSAENVTAREYCSIHGLWRS